MDVLGEDIDLGKCFLLSLAPNVDPWMEWTYINTLRKGAGQMASLVEGRLVC